MKLDIIKDILVSQYRIITRHYFGLFGAVIILFFCLTGLLGPMIAPHQPWDTLRDSNNKLAILRPPSAEFPLGTTALGRDIFSQMLFATRTTVLIGLVSGLISILIGANIGLWSGFYGGRLDEFLMRFTDIVYGMPFLPFLIVLIALFGPQFVVCHSGHLLYCLADRGPGHPGPDPFHQTAPVRAGGQSPGMFQLPDHLPAYHAQYPAAAALVHRL